MTLQSARFRGFCHHQLPPSLRHIYAPTSDHGRSPLQAAGRVVPPCCGTRCRSSAAQAWLHLLAGRKLPGDALMLAAIRTAIGDTAPDSLVS